MVRRLIVGAAFAMALAGVGVGAIGPEAARAEGCRAFGEVVATAAQTERPFGQSFNRAFGSPGFTLQQAQTKACR